MEMEAFINQEKEFSVISSSIPQRISTLVNYGAWRARGALCPPLLPLGCQTPNSATDSSPIPAPPTESNEEQGKTDVRAIKTDLAQAKQLIQDMEMSNRTIAEPTKRDVAKKISVHRETIKTLEKDLALAEQKFDRGALFGARGGAGGAGGPLEYD